jgi:hypothetical protein
MTIQDLVDLAVNSELKNIAIKSDTDAVIGYMNLGLIELYKRFPLSVQEHLIELQDGVEIYDMPSDFMWMVAAYDEVPEDSAEPVMPIAINEEDNPASINMISYNQVQIPVTVTGAYISLIYIASPQYYTPADLAETLPIPPQMVEALLHYIGYRAHGAMDGNIQAENSTHYQRFELSCKRIEQNGMFTSDDLSMSDRYMNSIWA